MSSETQHEQYPVVAYGLSLAAGALMIIGSMVAIFWTFFGAPFWGWTMGYGWGMMGYRGLGPGYTGFAPGVFGGIAAIGLISGIIVLVAAVFVRSRPREHTTWAVLILVFSITSFFGMGGFFVGAIIGVIGAILALGWSPGTAM